MRIDGRHLEPQRRVVAVGDAQVDRLNAAPREGNAGQAPRFLGGKDRGGHFRRAVALRFRSGQKIAGGRIRLTAGQPIRFGVENERGVARAADGHLAIVDVASVGEDELIVHDPGRSDPGLAFSLARLAEDPTVPTPIGIFRDVQRPVYGRSGSVRRTPATDVELADLLVGSDSWAVS